jgi:ABC-type antimicrobial peptide transport system permease subunit
VASTNGASRQAVSEKWFAAAVVVCVVALAVALVALALTLAATETPESFSMLPFTLPSTPLLILFAVGCLVVACAGLIALRLRPHR